MNVEGIRKHSKRTPWRPFVLVLDNGRRILVRHPEALVIVAEWEIAVVENGTIHYLGPEAVSEIEFKRRRA